MKCMGRDSDEITSYEEVKKDVIWYYQEKQYDDLVDSLEQNAIVTINQSEFDKMNLFN